MNKPYITFSNHANIRMSEKRQKGITKKDVIDAVKNFVPGSNIYCFRIKNIRSKSGKRFNVVVSSKEKNKRLIISVIGR